MEPLLPTAGGRSLPDLPTECLQTIMRRCPRSTLKNLRLCSKSFASMCEPELWRYLRVVPSADCLSQVMAVLEHSSVAKHVRHLVYDASYQYILTKLRLHSGDSMAVSLSPAAKKVMARAWQVELHSPHHSVQEITLLTRLLLLLPNVDRCTVNESDGLTAHKDSQLPFYYRKIFAEAAMPPPEPKSRTYLDDAIMHCMSLVHATYAIGRNLVYLALQDFNWHKLESPYHGTTRSNLTDMAIRKAVFGRLKVLKLFLTGTPSNLSPLRHLLKYCASVERLYLSSSNPTHRQPSTEIRLTSYLRPLLGSPPSGRPILPRLEVLHLNGIVCSQDDLCTFLKAHSSTLRGLGISNMILIRAPDSDVRGCWVRVIHSLKKNLKLKWIKLGGWFYNGGRQRWYVTDDPSAGVEGRIRETVTKYILDDTAHICPLTQVAIQQDQEDVCQPASGLEFEGDWTWTMMYPDPSKLLERRRVELLSGSHHFSKDVPLDSDQIHSLKYNWPYTGSMQPPELKHQPTSYSSENIHPTKPSSWSSASLHTGAAHGMQMLSKWSSAAKTFLSKQANASNHSPSATALSSISSSGSAQALSDVQASVWSGSQPTPTNVLAQAYDIVHAVDVGFKSNSSSHLAPFAHLDLVHPPLPSHDFGEYSLPPPPPPPPPFSSGLPSKSSWPTYIQGKEEWKSNGPTSFVTKHKAPPVSHASNASKWPASNDEHATKKQKTFHVFPNGEPVIKHPLSTPSASSISFVPLTESSFYQQPQLPPFQPSLASLGSTWDAEMEKINQKKHQLMFKETLTGAGGIAKLAKLMKQEALSLGSDGNDVASAPADVDENDEGDAGLDMLADVGNEGGNVDMEESELIDLFAEEHYGDSEADDSALVDDVDDDGSEEDVNGPSAEELLKFDLENSLL